MTQLLAEIGQRIIDQDGRITAEPLFAVMQKREIVVDGDYDHDRIVWIGEEGREADEETAARLNTMRNDIDDDYFMDNEITLTDEDEGDEEWRYLAIKDVDEFVTACFTEHGCKEYLKANGHNLRRPFTYVFSGNRNAEFIALRKLMMDTAKQEASL